MPKPIVGFRLPPDAFDKLTQLADATFRPKAYVVAMLVMAAEAQPDGSIRVRLPAIGCDFDAAAV